MKKLKIQILGAGCSGCKNLYKNVQELVKKLKIDAEVEYSDDVIKIAEIGAMRGPVLVINGHILTEGKLPDLDEIAKLILNYQLHV